MADKTAGKQNQEQQPKHVPGKPFAKGDLRINRKGRPPRKSLTAFLEQALTDDARKKVAKKIVELMKKGDVRAIEFAFDRVDGKVPQRIDIADRVRELAREAGLSDEDTEAAIAEAQTVIREHAQT